MGKDCKISFSVVQILKVIRNDVMRDNNTHTDDFITDSAQFV